MITLGDTVMWKAAGKVSRLDGVAGTTVTGVVQEINNGHHRKFLVKKDYDSLVELARLDEDQILGSTLKEKQT